MTRRTAAEALMLVSPFETPGLWLKGNLHTHTRMSDGDLEPEEVLAWHHEHGYDFVAITDHDGCTVTAPPDGLTLLPGAEISVAHSAAGAPLHVVAVGLPPNALPEAGHGPATLGTLRELGALGILAHPTWSALTNAEVLAYRDCLGIEIYNTGSEYESRTGASVGHWDAALAAGWRALAVAADDSHWKLPDHGGGWIMLRAASRAPADLLAALRAGQFYPSCGPRLDEVRVDGLRVSVRCSPVESIYWRGQAHLGWSRHAAPGAAITDAEFEIDRRCRYVRVEALDSAGRAAWSQPVMLTP